MEKEQNKQFEEKESKSPDIEDKQNNDQIKPEDKLSTTLLLIVLLEKIDE